MNQQDGLGTGGSAADSHTHAELTLEHEKIQIERERLALERERVAAERDKWHTDQALQQRAAGRVSIGISTLALALLVALLFGGTVGAWVVSARERRSNDQMQQALITALATDTNQTGRAGSPFLRALSQPGRRGGYLLILD